MPGHKVKTLIAASILHNSGGTQLLTTLYTVPTNKRAGLKNLIFGHISTGGANSKVSHLYIDRGGVIIAHLAQLEIAAIAEEQVSGPASGATASVDTASLTAEYMANFENLILEAGDKIILEQRRNTQNIQTRVWMSGFEYDEV